MLKYLLKNVKKINNKIIPLSDLPRLDINLPINYTVCAVYT